MSQEVSRSLRLQAGVGKSNYFAYVVEPPFQAGEEAEAAHFWEPVKAMPHPIVETVDDKQYFIFVKGVFGLFGKRAKRLKREKAFCKVGEIIAEKIGNIEFDEQITELDTEVQRRLSIRDKTSLEEFIRQGSNTPSLMEMEANGVLPTPKDS